MSERTKTVLDEVAAERERQTAKHGDQSHLPMGTGPEQVLTDLPTSWWHDDHGDVDVDALAPWARRRCKAASENEGGDGTITFEHILTEEWAEVLEEDDPARLRVELIQLAATAVQMVEALDRARRVTR